MNAQAGCAYCAYPISISREGQTIACPMCDETNKVISQAVSQGGVTFPTVFVVGLISFVFGIMVGPSVIASTQEGSKWLERRTRERLSR